MNPTRRTRNSREAFAGLVAVATLLTGCATAGNGNGSAQRADGVALQMRSPRAVELAPVEAWKRAEALVAGRPDRDVLIGRGGSMKPMYPDRTILVVERMKMASLLPGMTVVFFGDSGRPVAHLLSHRTSTGWVARGLANGEEDCSQVRPGNYVGTVVAAFITPPSLGRHPSMVATAALGGVPAAGSGILGPGSPDRAYFSGRQAAGQ